MPTQATHARPLGIWVILPLTGTPPTPQGSMLVIALAAVPGCAISDGTAFGAPYALAASPAPRLESGDLVFFASYKSTCPGGGSM